MKKIAIVTGGCRGIGLATTRIFLDQGWQVAVVDRDRDELHTATAGLDGVLAVEADISDPEQVLRMTQETLARFGRIDALINNAGVALFSRAGKTSFQEWREVMETNLDGVFLCTQAVAPELAKTKGAIVNIASISGLRASTLRVAYGTSKAAVIHLTKQFAAELGEAGHPRQLRGPRPCAHQAGHGRPRARDHRRLLRRHPAEPLWRGGRDRRGGRLSGLGQGQLHQRADFGGGWWL